MHKSYSGAEFVKALADGSLKPPLVLAGVAKLAPQDTQAILFAAAARCASWIRVPIDLIDKVEYVGTVREHDQEYPYVFIWLKEVANNPAAALLADILRLSELNPQPLPPRDELNPQPLPPRRLSELNPQPLPPRR